MNQENEPRRYCFLGASLRDSENGEDISRCEDADPLIEKLPDGRIFACVADGLGGYTQGFEGKSGGFIASRAAVQATLEFFRKTDARQEGNPAKLTNHVYRTLRHLAEWKLPPSRVRGTLGRHRLATTLAVAVLKNSESLHETQVSCYWIGDSRIYYFSSVGLHMLTRDDNVTRADAFVSTFESPPMSQFLAASMEREWSINFGKLTVNSPGVMLLCSDGCFADWETPWRFELALQKALDCSDDWDEWLRTFKIRLDRVRSDDASLIAYPLNLTEFQQFKDLRKENADKNPAILALEAETEGRIPRKQIWETIYKPVYENKILSGATAQKSEELKLNDAFEIHGEAQAPWRRPFKKFLIGSWTIGLISGIPLGIGLAPWIEDIKYWIKSLCPFT